MNSERDSNLNGIKLWPKSERPRERLLSNGGLMLTDAELLAILLRNGIRGKDVIQFSRELLMRFGGFRGLFAIGVGELQGVKGLGDAKICTLIAMREISRRQLREELIGKTYVRDPKTVLDYLYASMRDQKKEIFKALFLNKANRIVEERTLFEGTVDETAVHPREVVKAAMDAHASSLILVHNHPSGRIQPSQEDVEITRKLEEACGLVSVKILDHIIIGDNRYFSFNEQQLLQ